MSPPLPHLRASHPSFGHRPRRNRRPSAYRPRVEALEGRLAPAVLTVLNTNDSGPGSLRQAILDANSLAGDDTITFAPGVTGTIDLLSPLPDLSSNIDLEGPGPASLTVEHTYTIPTPAFGIFHVTGAATTVTLAGLKIANGYGVAVPDSLNYLGGPDIAGGGIFNDSAVLTVSNCIIANNFAGSGGGGGIANYSGTLTLAGSTVVNNTASSKEKIFYPSGAIYPGNGGGIWSDGSLTISNSTIAGNSAVGGSGGGLNGSGAVYDSIIARNTLQPYTGPLTPPFLPGPPAAFYGPDVNGSIASQGHNLIGDGTNAGGFAASDLVGTTAHPIDPRLGPLQDNGGPTPTMALLPGSPAIDAGDNANAPPTDQRGLPRIVHGVIDIGAFEYQGPFLSPGQAFVAQVYRDVLGREADPGGLAAFSAVLDQGLANRYWVVLAIETSLEGRIHQVEGLYQQVLGRPADPGGLAASVQFLLQGGSPEQLEAILLGSPEYYQVRGGGTADGFMQALYRDVLGRAPDPAGLAGGELLQALGMPRVQLALAVLTSPEGDTMQVETFYQEALGRVADPGGLLVGVQALQRGLPSDLYFAILEGSDEKFAGLNP